MIFITVLNDFKKFNKYLFEKTIRSEYLMGGKDNFRALNVILLCTYNAYERLRIYCFSEVCMLLIE